MSGINTEPVRFFHGHRLRCIVVGVVATVVIVSITGSLVWLGGWPRLGDVMIARADSGQSVPDLPIANASNGSDVFVAFAESGNSESVEIFAPVRSRVQVWPRLTIYFVVRFLNYGSYMLRGTMMAEAMALECKRQDIPWVVEPLDVEHEPNWEDWTKKRRPDLCIFVKSLMPLTALEWCRQHGAQIWYDILDNHQVVQTLLSNRTPKSLNEEDVLILQTHKLASHVKQRRLMKAVVLQHHHTNSGFVRNISALDRVETVGLLAGEDKSLPAAQMLQDLAGAVCAKDNLKRFLVISQGSRKTYEYRCEPNATGQVAFNASNSSHSSRRILETSPIQEDDDVASKVNASFYKHMKRQAAFHNHASENSVDIGLLWPPNRDTVTMYRPVTRLLYWLSHGVPSVFFPYYAYTEVAEEFGYFYDDSNTTPVASNLEEVGEVLRYLVPDAALSARIRLREVGFLIAQNFTLQANARKLIHHIRAAFTNETLSAA